MSNFDKRQEGFNEKKNSNYRQFFILKNNRYHVLHFSSENKDTEESDIPDAILRQISENYVDQIPPVVADSNMTLPPNESNNNNSSHPPLDENVLQYLFTLEQQREHENNSPFDWVENKSCETMNTDSLNNNNNVLKDVSGDIATGCTQNTSHSESSDDDVGSVTFFKRLYKFNPKPLVEKPSMRRHRHQNNANKDPEYIEKRRKNNEASRRSRLARRYKECLVVQEMNKLREENRLLKDEIERLKELNNPSCSHSQENL